MPRQSRSAEYEFARVDDFASVFVTPVAAGHFRLALLLRLFHMTADTKPVHRLGIGNCPVAFNSDRSAGRDEVLVAFVAADRAFGSAHLALGVALVASYAPPRGRRMPVMPERVNRQIHVSMATGTR